MYFILKGATFPTTGQPGFIGKITVTPGEVTNSYSVSYSLTGGITRSSCPGFVVKEEKLTATFTLADDSSLIGTPTCSSGTLTHSISGRTVTIEVTGISANCTVTIKATESSSGGDSGGSEPETPVNPPSSDFTAVPYTSQLSSSGLSKTDGSILSSGTGYVNVYENLDFTKTYYASGYAPASTGNNAIVCYYKADGTFISAESSSDWGISSQKYEHRQLTIPANTAIIKLFGRTNSGEGCTLEIGANYTLISHSEINQKSNLSEADGSLGTSASGVVKTYNNIDTSKTYVADGFCPNATGSAAFVCYYNSSNAFISSQDGNDFGLSSQAASKVTLTVPSGTSTIKLFGQSGSSDPYLYTVE